MTNNREYEYTHLATGATTQIFTGRGLLQAITINSPAAGTITIQDGTASSPATIGIIAASSAAGTYWFNCSISTGLRIILGSTTDITVTWAQG